MSPKRHHGPPFWLHTYGSQVQALNAEKPLVSERLREGAEAMFRLNESSLVTLPYQKIVAQFTLQSREV